MKWKRPTHTPYPHVWQTFEGLQEVNGAKPIFWIQDVPKNVFDKVVDLYVSHFINEEPICKYIGISKDPEALEEASQYCKKILSQKLSCVCMTIDAEGKPTMAAYTLISRASITDEHALVKSEAFVRLTKLINYVLDSADPFKHFELTEYLRDRGMYVLPEYRRQGISYQFANCWRTIAKVTGFKVVLGMSTGATTQRIAERAGFKALKSFDYLALSAIDPDFCLPGIEEEVKSLVINYSVV